MRLGVTELIIIAGVVCLLLLLVGAVVGLAIWLVRQRTNSDNEPE